MSIVFAVVLFSIIWLAPETMFKLTQYVFGDNISPLQAFKMLMLHIPGVVQQSIPVAALLGCLFVFQRLSTQYEIVAMFAAGISSRRLIKSVLVIGAVFAVFLTVIDEFVTPYTGPMLENAYTGLKLKDQVDRNFIFVDKGKNEQLKSLFLIGQAQKNSRSDFIVLDYQPDPITGGVRISRIIRANTGSWASNNNEWLLKSGIVYQLDEEGVYTNIQEFKQLPLPMNPYAYKLLDYSTDNPKFLNVVRLSRYIGLLEEGSQQQDVPYFQVRLIQKLVAPLAAIFFAVVGALLGIERVRSQNSYGLLFGAILIFTYSVLMPFSSNIAALMFLPVWLVAWFPLLVSALVAWLLLSLKKQLA